MGLEQNNYNNDAQDNSIGLEILSAIMGVFYYARVGLHVILSPIKGITSKKDSTVKEVNNAISKAYEVKEDTFLEKLWKNSSIYKKQQENIEKEKKELAAILNSEEGTKRQDKPVTYRYKVRDDKGRIEEDTFLGASMADCNAFLVNEGYEVISIKYGKKIEFLYGQTSILGANKLSTKDLIFWLTQLSTYIKSGIPLTDSMRILAKQMGARDKNKKRVFNAIIYELTLGESFSNALAKQGNIFPPLLINMLKAAEATGELEETLDDMANYYDELDKTRRAMISALTYPAIVMVFAIGVICFILMYVVPQFVQIYESSGIEIKGLTLFVINTATFLTNNFITLIFIVILAIITIIILYKNVKAFRKRCQVLLMKTPIIKNLIIYNEVTIFAKTFASLLKNNVFITDSIDILVKVTQNEIYKEIMLDTINNIAKGDKISDSFRDHWAVPDVAYYMIVTGESTGELSGMMERVSSYFQDLHSNTVTTLKSFIEPIMIVILAVIVGGVILAVIIPMFDMYNQISM